MYKSDVHVKGGGVPPTIYNNNDTCEEDNPMPYFLKTDKLYLVQKFVECITSLMIHVDLCFT